MSCQTDDCLYRRVTHCPNEVFRSNPSVFLQMRRIGPSHLLASRVMTYFEVHQGRAIRWTYRDHTMHFQFGDFLFQPQTTLKYPSQNQMKERHIGEPLAHQGFPSWWLLMFALCTGNPCISCPVKLSGNVQRHRKARIDLAHHRTIFCTRIENTPLSGYIFLASGYSFSRRMLFIRYAIKKLRQQYIAIAPGFAMQVNWK